MEDFAAAVLPAVRAATGVIFAALAVIASVRASRSGRAGWWLTAAFGALTLVLLRGWVTNQLGVEVPGWLRTVELLVLLAFPYLLLRFTGTFRPLPRWLEVAAAAAAIAVLLATVAWAPLNQADRLPTWTAVYVPAVAAYWGLVSSVTVLRLWRAGRGQPTLARRRMRLMSTATALLAVVLLVLASRVGGDSSLMDLAVHTAVLASGIAFGLGFSPPLAIRRSWAQPEQQQLHEGTMALLAATTVDDVAQALLPPTVRIVGGAGAAVVDPGGHVVASYGRAPETGTVLQSADAAAPGNGAREVVPLVEGHGDLVVWTSPYTPFFGREEVDLLQSMAAVAGLALQRSDLLADERRRRVVLEEAQQQAESARLEATQANMAKTDFLSRMSHELRTPLNAVLGFGQLLELSALTPEDDEAVGHILKAGRHLLALINDVLDLSRIEAGTMALSLEPVHTGELIDDAVALMQPMAQARSIRMVADLTGCDVYVEADRQRCRQILLNLLSNAVKYNHDGGEVAITCRPDGETVRVSVRDTGSGIDPRRQQQLFEPFERLGAESSGVEGTGLGLALTKQLVEAMGGAIGLDTAPGEGSTFWIDLPVTEPPVDAEQPSSDPQQQTADGTPVRTMLLVEDNLTNLRLVEAMLRRRPEIQVLPAMQGRLAIDLALEHLPDLIVLDLQLPDLPGREILQRLQADRRTRDIPVVIASADATPGRVRQLRDEGAFDYITKPLEVQPFLDVVDAALAHRDGTRDSHAQP